MWLGSESNEPGTLGAVWTLHDAEREREREIESEREMKMASEKIYKKTE